jgi:hypothetical protein
MHTQKSNCPYYHIHACVNVIVLTLCFTLLTRKLIFMGCSLLKKCYSLYIHDTCIDG